MKRLGGGGNSVRGELRLSSMTDTQTNERKKKTSCKQTHGGKHAKESVQNSFSDTHPPLSEKNPRHHRNRPCVIIQAEWRVTENSSEVRNSPEKNGSSWLG